MRALIVLKFEPEAKWEYSSSLSNKALLTADPYSGALTKRNIKSGSLGNPWHEITEYHLYWVLFTSNYICLHLSASVGGESSSWSVLIHSNTLIVGAEGINNDFFFLHLMLNFSFFLFIFWLSDSSSHRPNGCWIGPLFGCCFFLGPVSEE